MIKNAKLLLMLGIGLISLQANAAAPQAAASQVQSASSVQANAPELNSQSAKLSYTIGVEMGKNFKSQGVDVNPDLLVTGLKDSLAGKKLLLSSEQMQQTIQTFQKQVIAKRKAEFKAVAGKNAREGKAFLSTNAKKPGVKKLAGGLQYKIVKQGNGSSPTAKDTVTVNYEGKFIDGTVFDSSYKRGKPASFPVSEVIPGWQEALKHMKPGATWELYVPAKLAYGEQGMGSLIGPNETLIFKIHLISIDKKA